MGILGFPVPAPLFHTCMAQCPPWDQISAQPTSLLPPVHHISPSPTASSAPPHLGMSGKHTGPSHSPSGGTVQIIQTYRRTPPLECQPRASWRSGTWCMTCAPLAGIPMRPHLPTWGTRAQAAVLHALQDPRLPAGDQSCSYTFLERAFR